MTDARERNAPPTRWAAALPSSAVLLLPTTGDTKSKPAPGAIHCATLPKLAPKPYSKASDWAFVLPPLRHCSPS